MIQVLLMGVGGAGSALLGQAAAMVQGRTVALNTDHDARLPTMVDEHLLIGSMACQGMPAVTPSRGARAAEESAASISALFADARQLLLFAGLGGGTGTGAAPVIVRLAQHCNMSVLAGVTLPFAFEDERRSVAEAGLAELQATGIPIVVHDHAQTLRHTAEQNFSLAAYLDQAATTLVERVLSQLG